MGDAGEGLVDADTRAAELRAEREEEKRRRKQRGAVTLDPARERQVRSLELARSELQRQAAQTENPRRREQIAHALADLEQRLVEATAPKA